MVMFRALIERRLPSALYRGGERHIRRGNELHCLVGFKRVSSCCQRGRALSVMCLTLLSTSPRMDPPDQLRTALRRPKWQKQTQSEDPERGPSPREKLTFWFSEFRLANPSGGVGLCVQLSLEQERQRQRPAAGHRTCPAKVQQLLGCSASAIKSSTFACIPWLFVG